MQDAFDDAAALASEHYGLEPYNVLVDTVTGQEAMSSRAVVSSGTRTEKIQHFSPGLSVEYELVRAARTAATAKELWWASRKQISTCLAALTTGHVR